MTDCGYDGPYLAHQLTDQPVEVCVRLRGDRVLYQDAPPGGGVGAKGGRPRRHGERFEFHNPDTWQPPAHDTVRNLDKYGNVRVRRFERLHPKLNRQTIWQHHPEPELPILPGTVMRLDVDRLPSGGSPKPLWLWWSRIGADADLADSAGSCFLRRFDLEHTFRYWKQHLGWTSICLRSPAAADRWTALVLTVYTQLRLARSLTDDLKRPWEKPLATHQLTPGRVRRGFRQVRRSLPVLTNAPKPSRPGPGRPPGRRNTRKAPTYEVGNAYSAQKIRQTSEQPNNDPADHPRFYGKLSGTRPGAKRDLHNRHFRGSATTAERRFPRRHPMHPGVNYMNDNLLLRLRLQSGMTQEELSERSGISVRTIRNVERGLIQRPRRSSVDMLLEVLDPGLKEKLRSAPMDDLGMPVGMAAEWLKLVRPEQGFWRGDRPPRSSLVGRRAEIELLAGLALEQQVVVLTGPGGVGKSRVALAAAESAGSQLRDGVAVVKLGLVPRERDLAGPAVQQLAEQAVVDLLGEEAGGTRQQLLVLDNAEHLPETTSVLVDRVLARFTGLHILVTARRAPALADAVLCELAPMDVQTAVELLLERLRIGCPGLDLTADPEQLIALVGLLDGLPRLIESAAHRLRMVPLESLLADGQAVRLLSSGDPRTLPHQRTPEASLRWSLDLLDDRHERLLAQLARASRSTFRVGEPALKSAEFTAVETVGLLADLAETSLLQVDRGGCYQYRMLRHVRAFLAESGGRVVGAPVSV